MPTLGPRLPRPATTAAPATPLASATSTPGPATTPATGPATRPVRADELPRRNGDAPAAATIGFHRGAALGVLLGASALGGCATSGHVMTASATPIGAPVDTDVGTDVAAEVLGIDTFGFESEWSSRPLGSIDATDVDAALSALGDKATPAALSELWGRQAERLNADGRAMFATHAARADLLVRAGDGKVTAAELSASRAALTDTYGAARAELALRGAFPAVIGQLDGDAAKQLLGMVSGIEGHAERVRTIVEEMMTGKNTLVDVDKDGVLDATDLVFTETPDGKVKVAEVGAKLADETKVAKAIVDASYKLSQSSIGFELIKNHRANPDFWDVGAGGVLTPKAGVNPSDAVADILNNSSKYGFECATGLVVVYYEAALDLLGPKDFDRVMKDLRIGPWVMEGDLDTHYGTSKPNPSGSTYDELPKDHAVVPGAYYYFKNWDVTPDAKARGWQGENVIYLGEGKYYGHGIGLGEADMFVSKLASEMEAGGKTPSLLNLTARISTNFLGLDKHPGE